MKNAIKRGLIVLIGVILQICFAISIRYFLQNIFLLLVLFIDLLVF